MTELFCQTAALGRAAQAITAELADLDHRIDCGEPINLIEQQRPVLQAKLTGLENAAVSAPALSAEGAIFQVEILLQLARLLRAPGPSADLEATLSRIEAVGDSLVAFLERNFGVHRRAVGGDYYMMSGVEIGEAM